MLGTAAVVPALAEGAPRAYRRTVIRSELSVAAPAAVVHAVLTDVTAWKLWSPHIDRVDAASDIIDAVGWTGMVKPWFGPATQMDVTWCEPARGIRWTSTAVGHRLDYADLITPDGPDGCTVTMAATVSGPAGALVQQLVGPLSAFGQRRRLARLGALAEFLYRRTIVFAA
ncbi:MAG: hypothetical protein QOF00_6291 [Pseudonocardiales bacterium]|nr:hypothetical protein [Pseudonocardiales bacterium]